MSTHTGDAARDAMNDRSLSGDSAEFKSDGTMSIHMMGATLNGTYKANGNNIDVDFGSPSKPARTKWVLSADGKELDVYTGKVANEKPLVYRK
jgi:hypothetical protein